MPSQRLLPILTACILTLSLPVLAQPVRRAWVGGGYASGVVQEPLGIGLRAKGGGAFLEAGYWQTLGTSRWMAGANFQYLTLDTHMEGWDAMKYFGQSAGQEQRFDLSYDEIKTQSFSGSAMVGYRLLRYTAWQPWVGLGLGYTAATFNYLHPVTNTRVYVHHLQPQVVSTVGLMGRVGTWYFDLKADAAPASFLTRKIHTNSQTDKASGPDAILARPLAFEVDALWKPGESLQIGPAISGQYRYAGDSKGGYLALTIGIRIGYQIGTWSSIGLAHGKRKVIRNDEPEDKDGSEEEKEDGTESTD